MMLKIPTMAFASGLAVAVALAVAPAAAQVAATQQVRSHPDGMIITPASSLPHPADAGGLAHTNFHIFVPRGQTSIGATVPHGNGETPASLACVYGLAPHVPGCNPTTLKTVATGGSKAIGIVVAYDNPNAAADLAVYSAQFGLPPITPDNFEVVYATGEKPFLQRSGEWELEAATDIEIAHALAPNAKIFLVEAPFITTPFMELAVQKAASLVQAAGGGQVSVSWGFNEFADESLHQDKFAAPGVVIFVSSGDSNGAQFPAVLPNVVGVGGTTIKRGVKANYIREFAWKDTGGGNSKFMPTPSYQSAISKFVKTQRGTPDVALYADPGAWIYSSFPYQGVPPGWLVIGGTSVAAPAAAAISNSTGHFNTSTEAELTEMYANMNNASEFADITQGRCNNDPKYSIARVGWDFCTGIGTLRGAAGN